MDDLNKTQPWRTLDYWTDKFNECTASLTGGRCALLFNFALRNFKDDPRAKVS